MLACTLLLPNKLYHSIIIKKVLESFSLRLFEPMEGIEPTTPRLQITCSGQLSYIGKMSPFLKRERKNITFSLYMYERW